MVQNFISQVGVGTTLGLLTLATSLGLISESALAITKDLEGKFTSGLNDSELTAQELGILTEINALNARGFIDSNNTNDVDFYQFSIDANIPLDVFFDIDLASDMGSSEDLDTGLDSMLWVFNTNGTLIAENDDNDFFDFNNPEPGSAPFGDSDSFIGALNLNPGNYFVAVSAFANESLALTQPNIDFTPLSLSGNLINGVISDITFDDANDDFASFGGYQLQIRTQEEDVPIPESSSLWAILGFGAFCTGLFLKNQLKQNLINRNSLK